LFCKELEKMRVKREPFPKLPEIARIGQE
jgi:hypothetical protein